MMLGASLTLYYNRFTIVSDAWKGIIDNNKMTPTLFLEALSVKQINSILKLCHVLNYRHLWLELGWTVFHFNGHGP